MCCFGLISEIGDVFDYRYYIKDDYIEVLIRKADGEEWLLEIDKDFGMMIWELSLTMG